MYRWRNELERLFRPLQGFRRIFSRFDKLDVIFLAFLYFALIVEALRYLNTVNTPESGSRDGVECEPSVASCDIPAALAAQLKRAPLDLDSFLYGNSRTALWRVNTNL